MKNNSTRQYTLSRLSFSSLLMLAYLTLTGNLANAQHQIFDAPTDSCYHNHHEYDTKVYSRFGNMHKGRLEISSLPEPTSNFVITYGSGFPDAARDALDYAAYIWSTVLVSDVDIKIRAEFTSMGGNLLAQGRGLSLHKGFAGAPDPEALYQDALADAIAGKDLNPSSSADIFIVFNSNVNWYYGTDLNVSGKFDFVTLALHELAHGLGFLGGAFYSSSRGTGSVMPFALMLPMNDRNGRLLLDYPGGSVELGDALTSNAVYLKGENGVAANSGKWPKVYAPGSYISGSSISHLDEGTYRPGNANSLMSPSFGRGEAVHDISPMIRGILKDMGWQINEAVAEEPVTEPEPAPDPDPEPVTYLPAVTPTDPQAGLEYYVYTGDWQEMPDFSTLSAADSGIVSNFDGFSSQLPEQYGLKLSGFFQAPTQGTYTLYVQGSDALQLQLHDNPVFAFSGTSAESQDSLSINLEAGYHPFYAYFLRRAPDVAFQVQMKDAKGELTSIPQEQLFYEAPEKETTITTASSLASGIQYAYYEGNWQSMPDLKALEPVERGLIDNFSLLPRKKEQGYAFLYEGLINAPSNGTYQFFLTSSDGSRLYVGDSLVVDNDGVHARSQAEGTIELRQGTHPVRIEFFNAQGEGSLSADVQLEGFERRSISSAELFYDMQAAEVDQLGALIKTEFSDVVLFPNPTAGQVVVEFNAPENNADIIISNQMGRVVRQVSGVASGTQLSLAGEPAGLYIVQVTSAGQTKVFKLMLR